VVKEDHLAIIKVTLFTLFTVLDSAEVGLTWVVSGIDSPLMDYNANSFPFVWIFFHIWNFPPRRILLILKGFDLHSNLAIELLKYQLNQ
jgi:hypothetical protein